MNEISKYAQEGHQKFRKAIFALIKSVTDKRISENKHEWFSVTKSILLNVKEPRRLSKAPTTEEKIVSKVTRGFLEIALSYDSMTEIPLYLKRYPQKLVWKSKYLEFVVTNYFNEVYILSERINAYTKKVMRLYKNTPNITKLSTVHKELNSFFNNDNNVRRGEHIHVDRYQDDDLHRLGYLEALYHNNASISADKLIAPEYKKALAFNKRKWLDFFEKRNKTYEEILGMYFLAIYSTVFDKNGNFIHPK